MALVTVTRPPLKVIASPEESSNHWQRNDYKGFHASETWDTADFSKVINHLVLRPLEPVTGLE